MANRYASNLSGLGTLDIELYTHDRYVGTRLYEKFKRTAGNVLTYIKATPGYQFNSLVLMGGASFLAYKSTDALSRQNWGEAGLWGVGALAAMLDIPRWQYVAINKRFRKYEQVRSLFERYGYQERIVRPLLFGACLRVIAAVASADTGHLEQFKETLRNHGMNPHLFWLPYIKPSLFTKYNPVMRDEFMRAKQNKDILGLMKLFAK